MKVLALASMKGGVGKTSTAVNLAALGAATGLRTLLWDLDPQAGATWSVGVEPEPVKAARTVVRGRREVARLARRTEVPGLAVLPADETLRTLDLAMSEKRHPARVLGKTVDRLADAYDLVVVDTPPGLTLVLENLIALADLALVPVEPTPLAIRTLAQLQGFIDERSTNLPLAAFFSLLDETKVSQRHLYAEHRATNPAFLTTAIPHSTAVERLGAERRPTVNSSPGSLASRRYRSLWAEVSERLDLAE
ncbi:MAG: ParA family protein [Microthrixaceae bacterium]